MAASKVSEVIDGVKEALQSVAGLEGGKVFHVVASDALFDESSTVPLPAAGVVYEGLRARAETDKNSHRAGLSSEVGVSIVLLVEDAKAQGEVVQGLATLSAIDLLDVVRRKLLDLKSPAGHTWRFVYEGPIASKKGERPCTLWIQRWATPIQLTPTN